MVGRKRKTPVPAAPKAEVSETPAASSASRRRSQRSSATKKSQYFETDSDSESDVKPRGKSSATKGRSSKKAKLEVDDFTEDDYQDDADQAESEIAAPKEDEDDEELDEDAPPKVTFVPLPKLRDTGGIEYVDHRLHQNTLEFLKDLKANNKRPWLKSHDQEFRRSLKDWESYVMTMTEKVIEVDETVPELPFKDVNFRIYRDVRFSHDPTPYKANYGAAWSRTGRKGPYACYYLHLEPGRCFVGGGMWHPPGETVAKLRSSIDERPQRWRRVLLDPQFRQTFLPDSLPKPKAAKPPPASKPKPKGRSRPKVKPAEEEEEVPTTNSVTLQDEEKAVIKAFAESNKENALKTKPKGFIAEHRDIELLKLRNYTVWKPLDDEVFTREDGQEEIQRIMAAMVGFVTFLNKIVMPDPGDDDDSSDEEEEEEGGEDEDEE